ncbi:MAG TPA: hypothetical protein VIY07_19635, partial [Pseudolabrys sp.]
MRIAIGVCAEAGYCNTNVAQRHAASEMMRMMASRSAKIFKPDGLRPLTKEFPLFMRRQQQCPLWVMCGRRLGKNFLTQLQHWSGAVMCPACLCGSEAAGHNAIRGSGPNQKHAL